MKTAARSVLALFSALLLTSPLQAQTTTQLWLTRQNGPANSADIGNAVAVDALGNVFVVGGLGYAGQIGAPFDFYTAKLAASDGHVIWDVHRNGPNNSGDLAEAVVLDSAGNPVVTGELLGPQGNNLYTAKYATSNGAILWQQSYDGPGHDSDTAVAIAIDGAGNVVVTANSKNADGHTGIYTAKYAAATGVPMWEKRYDPADVDANASAVAVDSAGNVLVTGGSDVSRYVVKYAAANGAIVWEYLSEPSSFDVGSAVAADASGDVVVVGTSYGAGGYNIYTAKFAGADGELLWDHSYDGPLHDFDYGDAVALDAAGNVFVAGHSTGVASGLDFYTAKYDGTSGNPLWEKRYDGPVNSDDTTSSLALDSSGNVVVAGTSVGIFGNQDYYLAKYYSANGHLIWESRYNGPANQNDHTGNKIALTADGGAVVTGVTDDNFLSFTYDIATIRLVPPTPDTVTLPPTLNEPAADSLLGTTNITVSYTLPEEALAGSVEIKFHDATHGVVVLLYPDAGGTTPGAPHSYAIDTTFPANSNGIDSASGGPIVDGTYTVLISYQDAFGNPRQSDFHLNVTVDNTPPDTFILSGPSGTVTSNSVDFTFSATEATMKYAYVLDSDPLLETANPLLTLSALSDGPHTLSVYAFDLAGHEDPTPATRSWVVDTSGPAPQFTSLYAKGGAVPNAGPGGDPRIQQSATWNGFGTPAVNDFGQVAYVGKWKAPAFKTPVMLKAQSGVGIFVGDDLLVKAGDPVPGFVDLVFKSFKDPVIDNAGHVAFIAGIKGPGVVSANDTVVVTNGGDGNLVVLAREGSPAPGVAEGIFKAFSNVSIKSAAVITAGSGPRSLPPPPGSESGIVFTAGLVQGGGVTAANDTGTWWIPSGGLAVTLVVREGADGFFPTPGDLVKTFSVLKPLGGSPGFGRGQVNSDTLYFFGSSTNHRQGLILANPGATSTNVVLGDLLNSIELPDARWAKLGLPSMDESTANATVLGMLKTGPGGVPSANAKGIFQTRSSAASWEPVVRTGDAAPGFSGGAVFSGFKDPLNAPDCADVAFIGTAKNGDATTATNDGLWFQPDFAPLMLIAREGAEPPGAPGAKWKGFSSVALAGGETGPLFTASLQKGPQGTAGPGGITGANDFALYGTDYFTGAVTELVREGQPLLGKTVKNFSVLKAAAGTAGTSRAFSKNHQVVLLVNFTDRSTAIVGIQLPESPLPPL